CPACLPDALPSSRPRALQANGHDEEARRDEQLRSVEYPPHVGHVRDLIGGVEAPGRRRIRDATGDVGRPEAMLLDKWPELQLDRRAGRVIDERRTLGTV